MSVSAKSVRNPGADLLRIVCMLMILTSHFFVHGKVLSSLFPHDVNFYPVWLIESLCYVMVNCFVLITGYFQCTASFRLPKLLLLWGQIIAISGGMYLLLCACGEISFGWEAFLAAACPVTQSRYWFATAYVILYALSPLLNTALARLNRREHIIAAAALFGIFVLGRNFVYWKDFANLHGGYSYTSFIVLYVIGACLRRYPPKKHPWLLWYFGLSALTAGSRILLTILWYRYEFPSMYLKVFLQYNSVPVVLASVCLFLWFVQLRIEKPFVLRLIGYFAPLTFGVYLLHEQIEVKNYLWPLLHPAQWATSPRLFLVWPLTVVLLFLVCAQLDWLRHTLSRLLHLPALAERISRPLGRAGRFCIDRLAGTHTDSSTDTNNT